MYVCTTQGNQKIKNVVYQEVLTSSTSSGSFSAVSFLLKEINSQSLPQNGDYVENIEFQEAKSGMVSFEELYG